MDATLPDFLDPAARDLVVVEGPDALSYLQSQVAQELRPLTVGAAAWTLVLEPAGRVVALARLVRTADERFELDTDAGFGEGLVERLERFKIRVAAEIVLQRADRAGPSAEHEALRIAAGWPRMGSEIVPGETIPASTGVVPVAVDFTKGCYPGQELVERMESRGSDAPQTLRIVEVVEGTSVGDPVVGADGHEVGSVTSVSGTVALAMVRRGVEIGRTPIHEPG